MNLLQQVSLLSQQLSDEMNEKEVKLNHKNPDVVQEASIQMDVLEDVINRINEIINELEYR